MPCLRELDEVPGTREVATKTLWPDLTKKSHNEAQAMATPSLLGKKVKVVIRIFTEKLFL
jgi:hypothetical protein